jgi:hypothetical protein
MQPPEDLFTNVCNYDFLPPDQEQINQIYQYLKLFLHNDAKVNEVLNIFASCLD